MLKRKVYGIKTEVPRVEVSGIVTESGGLFIQIRDTELNDALWSECFTSPLGAISDKFVMNQLELLAKGINESTFENLLSKHLFKKYKFYVEQGWANNFKEFKQKFSSEMDIEEEERNENV